MTVLSARTAVMSPMPPRRVGSPAVSHETGFWLVGFAFTVVMAFAALPTPLYVLYAQRDGLSSTLIACVFASYAVGVVLSLLTVGHISDRVGRRPTMLAGLGLALGAGAVFSTDASLPGLLVARLLSGLAVGMVTTTATAYLSDLHSRSRPHATARRTQLVAAAANLGGIGLGPLTAGVLAQFALAPLVTPYVVSEVLLVIAAAALALTPETVWRSGQTRDRVQRIAVPRPIRATFAAAALGAGISFAILGMFSALVPSFLADALHEPSHAVAGAVTSIVFLASAATQLVDRRTSTGALRAPVAVAGVGLGLLTAGTWIGALTVFIVGALVTGVAVGLIFKSMLAAVLTVAAPGRRSEVLAAFFVAAYLGLAVPVLALGVLAEHVSTSALMTVFAGAAAAGLAGAARGLHTAAAREAVS